MEGYAVDIQSLCFFWACFGILTVATASPTSPPTEPAEKAEKAIWPIRLREEQAGIAGTTVMQWTVEKDGKWTLAQCTLSRGKEVEGSRSEKSGKLTPEQ